MRAKDSGNLLFYHLSHHLNVLSVRKIFLCVVYYQCAINMLTQQFSSVLSRILRPFITKV